MYMLNAFPLMAKPVGQVVWGKFALFAGLRATEVLKSLEPCSKFLQSVLVFGEPQGPEIEALM